MPQLSRRSRVAYSIILKMLNNPEHNATLQTLEAVAQALGVKVTDLIEDDTPSPK